MNNTLDEGRNRIRQHPFLSEDVARLTIRIILDGQSLSARAGETIAATLLTHGILLNRTMPETSSPRGVFCGIGRCPDCMMTVNGELNVRACVTTVSDEMVVETQQGLGEWKGRT